MRLESVISNIKFPCIYGRKYWSYSIPFIPLILEGNWVENNVFARLAYRIVIRPDIRPLKSGQYFCRIPVILTIILIDKRPNKQSESLKIRPIKKEK